MANTYKNIKDAVKDQLKSLEDMATDASLFLDPALAEILGALTAQLGREVCVYVARNGRVHYVMLGEDDRADLADMTLRRSRSRLSGLRCIHTHPGGDGRLSDVDIQSLKKLRFDSMCAIGVTENGTTDVSMAVLSDGENGFSFFRAPSVARVPQGAWMNEIFEADRAIEHEAFEEKSEQQRVMLIGHEDASLDELGRLVDTAGGLAVYRAVQRSTRGMIGSGKVRELSLTAQSLNVDLAVYDDELSLNDQRSLEEGLGVPVIDRTALILDIFAMRAATKEGKMQVELAQLQYRLSRLKGEGLALSRQGGGIGTRGPGEEKLENDRRHVTRRIYELKEQLAQLSARRGRMRSQRKKQDLPQLALVGYTNAGKSTLLKALSGQDIFCEDKLFATLDPLTRRVSLEKGTEVCLTDTVGFIKKLPHQLVEAFRSTLEEAVFADVLIHVCDASDPQLYEQMRAVDEVLTEIGAADIPTVTVLNKVDKVEGERPNVRGAVYISAHEGTGLEELKHAILEELRKQRGAAEVFVPYARGDVLSYIFAHTRVTEQAHEDTGTRVSFIAPPEEISRIAAKLR